MKQLKIVYNVWFTVVPTKSDGDVVFFYNDK